MENSPNPQSQFKGKTGIRRIINAYHYSCAGLKAAFEEQGFRQLVYLNGVLVFVALFFSFALMTKALLIAVSFGLLIIELFNTSIEAAVDHTSLEKHHLAKRAKDTASAAQLLGIVTLIIVWIFALISDKPWQGWF